MCVWHVCEHSCVCLKRAEQGFLASPASAGLPGRLEGALGTEPQVLVVPTRVAQPLGAAREAGARGGGGGDSEARGALPQPRLWAQSQGLRVGTV